MSRNEGQQNAHEIVRAGAHLNEGRLYRLEVGELREIDNGVETLVRAWDRNTGEPIGFGADGSVEIERFRFFTPAIRVPTRFGFLDTPKGAFVLHLEHIIQLVGKRGTAIVSGRVGHTTSTFFPAAGANDPVDGYFERNATNELFTTIRNGSGDSSSNTDTQVNAPRLVSGSTNNRFSLLRRPAFVFDTSTISSGDTVSAATLSIFGSGKANSLGSPDIHVAGAVLAANDTVAFGDFVNTPHTSFGSMTYAAWANAYNDFVLNASGIAAINKGAAARSKFSLQLDWDINNSFTGSWVSGVATHFGVIFADTALTTSDPKLVVTHAAETIPHRILQMNQAVNRASTY